MIDSPVIALIEFAFVMSISPGPSNFLLLASGANFGYPKSIPLVLGISSGFLSIVFGVGIGLGKVFELVPEIYTVLKVVCVSYILWLSWKIANSGRLGEEESELNRPMSILQGAMLQIVNPKAWAVAIILTVSYTDSDNYYKSLLFLIPIFALVNIPSISVWALSGGALKKILGNSKHFRFVNIFLALLLCLSMVPVIMSST